MSTGNAPSFSLPHGGTAICARTRDTHHDRASVGMVGDNDAGDGPRDSHGGGPRDAEATEEAHGEGDLQYKNVAERFVCNTMCFN